jgi:hypothetical protein
MGMDFHPQNKAFDDTTVGDVTNEEVEQIYDAQ